LSFKSPAARQAAIAFSCASSSVSVPRFIVFYRIFAWYEPISSAHTQLAAIASYRENAVRLAVSRGILLDELGVNIDTEALKTSLPGKRKKLDLPPPPISSAN
jgi:hypothetical protein